MARNEKMKNAVAAVEGRTATIGEICEKAKSRIIAEVQRHAAKHPQSPWNGKPLVELERTLRKLYADWGADAKKEFSATLPETMREWRKLAFDAIREDGASAILGEPNTDTVRFFLNDSFSRIAARTERMAADHISQLRRISAEVFRTASITGETRTQISRRLIAEAMDIKGFAFIDKAGRRWGDKSYFSMLARTELMNAGRTAYMDKCAEEGYDVMELSTSGDSCEACAQYEGELFSLTGAVAGLPAYGDLMDAGVFHPNCTHSFYAVPEAVWRERMNAAK